MGEVLWYVELSDASNRNHSFGKCCPRSGCCDMNSISATRVVVTCFLTPITDAAALAVQGSEHAHNEIKHAPTRSEDAPYIPYRTLMRFYDSSGGGIEVEHPMLPTQPPTINGAPSSKRKTPEAGDVLGGSNKKAKTEVGTRVDILLFYIHKEEPQNLSQPNGTAKRKCMLILNLPVALYPADT